MQKRNIYVTIVIVIRIFYYTQHMFGKCSRQKWLEEFAAIWNSNAMTPRNTRYSPLNDLSYVKETIVFRLGQPLLVKKVLDKTVKIGRFNLEWASRTFLTRLVENSDMNMKFSSRENLLCMILLCNTCRWIRLEWRRR